LIASLTASGRALAKHIFYCQVIVIIVLSVFFAVFFGHNSAISSLLGGVICMLPSAIFAYFAFRYAGASKNKLVVQQFNKGSKLKFFTTIIFFIVVYQWKDVQPLPLLLSYVVTLVSQWPAILFLGRVRN
jgi:ATP synthase protein I|tara:strand:+ start:11872 stop:12261 length:390 start_codon:yes stop_codon:yes gene_type:complete